MPEGHTIYRFAREHDRCLAGHRLTVTSPQGRFRGGAAKVNGKILNRVYAHGKHLFYEFLNDLTIHVHLGLRGDFRYIEPLPSGKAPTAVGQVRLRLVTSKTILELTGPTACDLLDPKQVITLRARLGPDLLDPRADIAAVRTVFARRSTPVGALVMDQSVISGIGNVYRSELLYRQRIHPKAPAKDLDDAAFMALWTDAVKLLKLGVRLGMILTVDLRSLKKAPAKTPRLDRYNVYKRSTCNGCGTKTKLITLAGRSCYYCPKEQKR